MAVTIRLRAQGCTNKITYRLVATDSRSPRDGKYIERLGWYNPYASTPETQMALLPDRVQHWLSQGAQMSPTVESLVQQAAPQLIAELHQRRGQRQVRNAAKRRELRQKHHAAAH